MIFNIIFRPFPSKNFSEWSSKITPNFLRRIMNPLQQNGKLNLSCRMETRSTSGMELQDAQKIFCLNMTFTRRLLEGKNKLHASKSWKRKVSNSKNSRD